MKNTIKGRPFSVMCLKKALIIGASFMALTACDTATKVETEFRVVESFDNKGVATAVDMVDDTVVTTGIYVGTRATLTDSDVIQEILSGDGQGIFVTKHDNAGALLWSNTVKMDEWNSVSDMKIDQTDGSIYLVGHTGPMPVQDINQVLDMFDNAVSKDSELTDLGIRPDVPYANAKQKRSWLIVKLASDGTEIFRRTWRECLPDTYDWATNEFLCANEAKKLTIGESGNIYVVGTGGSPWPMEKVQIASFDSLGNTLWDELRTDIHVGPLVATGTLPAVLDTVAEAAILNDPSQYKVVNYDTSRLMHYAWSIEATSSNDGDVIYVTIPAERKDLRGVVKLNQDGDIIASRKNFYTDLITTIKPLVDGRVLFGGQVDAPGTNDHGESLVMLADSDFAELDSYSYPVFDGVTFGLVTEGSDVVYGAVNTFGIANRDVSVFKLTGISNNSLNIEWDNLYSTTPFTIPGLGDLLEAFSVDTGKELLMENGNLVIVGDAYKTEGVLVIDLPSEDFIEPIITARLKGKGLGFIPLIDLNFNVNINLPDALHLSITGADSVRFKVALDPATGVISKADGFIGEELSAVAQRANGKLVQVTRTWAYDDNNLRRITVRQ